MTFVSSNVYNGKPNQKKELSNMKPRNNWNYYWICKKYRAMGVLLITSILTACVDSDSESTTEETQFIPATKSISSLAIVDAQNNALPSAQVVLTPKSQVSSFSSMPLAEPTICADVMQINSVTEMTSEEGDLNLDGLAAGTYDVHICKDDLVLSLEFQVSQQNASEQAVIAAPVIIDQQGGLTPVASDNLLVTVSGVIYSADGVVASAQVSISGGALTNGAIATSITDENGFYSLVLNLSKEKLTALTQASLRIVAEGFEPLIIEGQDFSLFSAFSGVNLNLQAQTANDPELVYQEGFESTLESAVCGEWTAETLATFSDTPNVDSPNLEGLLPSLWHLHQTDLAITNQAWLDNLVSLAPNDTSLGLIPDPSQGQHACWYGSGDSGELTEGNFLNEAGDNTELNGGDSLMGHAGALVSPIFDFTNEVAPLALAFDTWWEIEAVNPNENGFDIMAIEYRLSGEEEWHILARLNPLTDPAREDGVYSLPFSNNGFNSAPSWIEVEGLSMDRFVGELFQLRFKFNTNDELYNGFRGWLIDGVTISKTEGTFPLWDEVDRIILTEYQGLQPNIIFDEVNAQMSIELDFEMKSLNTSQAQFSLYELDGEVIGSAFAQTQLQQGELQQVHMTGSVSVPELDYILVLELLDAEGNIFISHPLYIDSDFSGPEE
jgi:hypothetical protein